MYYNNFKIITIALELLRGDTVGIEKKVYSFRFEEDMVTKLKNYASQENRTFSNFVETILLNYIAEREKEN